MRKAEPGNTRSILESSTYRPRKGPDRPLPETPVDYVGHESAGKQVHVTVTGSSAVGSAPALGAGGRGFKSPLPDQKEPAHRRCRPRLSGTRRTSCALRARRPPRSRSASVNSTGPSRAPSPSLATAEDEPSWLVQFDGLVVRLQVKERASSTCRRRSDRRTRLQSRDQPRSSDCRQRRLGFVKAASCPIGGGLRADLWKSPSEGLKATGMA